MIITKTMRYLAGVTSCAFLILSLVLCSLAVVSSRACASETPSSSTAFRGKVKVKKIAEIDDYLRHPVACYDEVGTLFIAGHKGIWAVRKGEGGHYSITRADWPTSIHLTKLLPPGILSMQFEDGVLVIGTPRYIEIEGLGTSNGTAESGTAVFDDGTTIPVKKLGLPADVEILGSQVVVGGSIVAYEPKRDALIRYLGDSIEMQSHVLHARSMQSESVLGMGDITTEWLDRNVWLEKLDNGNIVGLDMTSGTLYVFNSELEILDRESPLPVLQGLDEFGMRKVVWHPAAYGNTLFQIIPVDNRIGLAIWDLNRDKPSYSTIGLGLKGVVFCAGVVSNSALDGAVLFFTEGKVKLQVYSFTITLPRT
jgi:hypothetical protein